MTFTESNSIL